MVNIDIVKYIRSLPTGIPTLGALFGAQIAVIAYGKSNEGGSPWSMMTFLLLLWLSTFIFFMRVKKSSVVVSIVLLSVLIMSAVSFYIYYNDTPTERVSYLSYLLAGLYVLLFAMILLFKNKYLQL